MNVRYKEVEKKIEAIHNNSLILRLNLLKYYYNDRRNKIAQFY